MKFGLVKDFMVLLEIPKEYYIGQDRLNKTLNRAYVLYKEG